MLCQFTFKNFRSYRDETIFDMQATSIEEFPDSLIPPTCSLFEPLLPVSVIFGANAGGKSNAISALAFLISRVLLPIKTSTNWIPRFSMLLTTYEPFLFDEISKSDPTEFEIFFRTGSAQYQYKLTLFENRVVEESLYYIKTPCQRRRSVCLFERTREKISLGTALKSAKTQQVSETIPFISFLEINYNFFEISDAVSWFKHAYLVNFASADSDHRFYSLLNAPEIKPSVLTLLEYLDIPIADYQILEKLEDNGKKTAEILTTHLVGDYHYQIALYKESEGTQKALSALPSVFMALATGGLLVVDELDAKLHPQLLRSIIEFFTDSAANKNHAQLVFSCHDISIMKNDLLRRDEIWFAARNEDSASELWSLYDIRDEKGDRIKNTAAYDKQYLAGRYGADPYFRKMIHWGEFDG